MSFIINIKKNCYLRFVIKIIFKKVFLKLLTVTASDIFFTNFLNTSPLKMYFIDYNWNIQLKIFQAISNCQTCAKIDGIAAIRVHCQRQQSLALYTHPLLVGFH